MWEDILKREGAKRLNHSLLKQITLSLAKEYKGKKLVKDEFLDFLEQIRKIYSAEHKSISLERIRTIVVRTLKTNNLLEVKTKKLGPEEYRKKERFYIFRE